MERPKMSTQQRAKQFMPFSALNGLNAALQKKEKEIHTVERPALPDDVADIINRDLCSINPGDKIKIKYYKSGEITTITGKVSYLNRIKRRIEVAGVNICLDDILEIIS